MTQSEAQQEALRRWWLLAEEALASARDDLAAGRLHRATSSAYYACFYAVSAVLFAEGKQFIKHTAVEAAVHRDLVRPGRIEVPWGDLYKALFEARQLGDYRAMTEFEPAQVSGWVDGAAGFIARLRELPQPEPGE